MILSIEIKKIIKSKTTKIALLCLFCWLIGSVIWIVQNSSWVDLKTGERINGANAIQQAKNEKSKWNGNITKDVLINVIVKNKEYIKSSGYNSKDLLVANRATAKTQEYEDIRELINRSYGEFFSYDYYTVDKVSVNDVTDFYENRVKQIQKWLNNEAANLPYAEKEYISNAAKNLKTPFYYSYMDGWTKLMNSMSIILLPLSLVICIILASVFAGEFQSGNASILLTSKYGRKHVAILKVAGSLIVTAVIYFTVMLIYTVSILGVYGFDGYQCPLQANASFWKTLYDWNNIEAYTALVSLGFIGCILLASITIFLSSVSKSSFATIAVLFILIIMPQMINTSGYPVLEKVISLMPHETMLGSHKLAYYIVYDLFGRIYTPFQLMPVLYVSIILVLIPISIRSFQRYQEQ